MSTVHKFRQKSGNFQQAETDNIYLQDGVKRCSFVDSANKREILYLNAVKNCIHKYSI